MRDFLIVFFFGYGSLSFYKKKGLIGAPLPKIGRAHV